MCIPSVCRLCRHLYGHILLLLLLFWNLLFTFWTYVHVCVFVCVCVCVCVCVLNVSDLTSKPPINATYLPAHLPTTYVRNSCQFSALFHTLHCFWSSNRQLRTFSKLRQFYGLALKKWHISKRYVTTHYSEVSEGAATVTNASQLPASDMLLLIECAQRLPRMRRYAKRKKL